MGDRGNIIVKQNPRESAIWLYSHWGGCELAQTLRRALARHQRWDDPPYLTRIIFCEMLRGSGSDPLDAETSYGISTGEVDNEHDYLIVDMEAQTVALVPRKSATPLKATPRKQWTFEDFCKTTASDPDELR